METLAPLGRVWPKFSWDGDADPSQRIFLEEIEMSTKIYEAWKVPLNRYSDFLRVYVEKVKPLVEDRFNKLCHMTQGKLFCQDLGILQETLELRKDGTLDKIDPDIKDEYFRSAELSKKVEKLCKTIRDMAIVAKDTTMLDMTCGVRAWILRANVFIIPFGINLIPEITEDFVKDYKYYNNTDQPDGISDSQWDKRRSRWEEIFKIWDMENKFYYLNFHDLDIDAYTTTQIRLKQLIVPNEYGIPEKFWKEVKRVRGEI